MRNYKRNQGKGQNHFNSNRRQNDLKAKKENGQKLKKENDP